MLKLFLWLRYLRKKKIVFLSTTAVALSVALLIVVASLFTGFIHALREAGIETMGDVIIVPPAKLSRYSLFIERLEQTNAVKAATATLSSQGLLFLGKGNVRAVEVWGIEPGRRTDVTGFKRFLSKQNQLPGEPSFEVAGQPEAIGGFLGIGVIAEPDEKTDEYDFQATEKMIGQQVVLTTAAVSKTQEQEDTRVQVKRKTIKFTIADIVFTGVYELDKNFVYLPIEQLQKQLYPDEDEQIADQIQIKLADNVQSESALAQIRGQWQYFATEQLGLRPELIRRTFIITSQQMQSRYIAELRKQMGVLLVIFGVVSFSVILLVFCIFYMIVITKQKDIAIIKSCGGKSVAVTWVFVGFGAFTGIIGSAIGTLLGYIITKNINILEEWIRIIFGLKLWKSSVYLFSKIPNEVDWDWSLLIVLSAVIAAAIGALVPSIVAARTRPVEILRYE